MWEGAGMLPPSAVGFCIALFFVFLIALFVCCYRQFRGSKNSPLMPIHRPRLVPTVDVQTGRPVLVDIEAVAAAAARARTVSVNTLPARTTLYGSIVPPHAHILGRSPPPKYSEVYPQPIS